MGPQQPIHSPARVNSVNAVTWGLTARPTLPALANAQVGGSASRCARPVPGVANAARAWSAPPDTASLRVSFELDVGAGQRLSMFTTLTIFGTPLDVTLAELAVELFYPADAESARLLRAR